MPDEIFVVKRRAANPGLPDGDYVDAFSHVATPVEMDDLPIGEPNENEFYYRLASFEKNHGTATAADTFWTDLKAEVSGLIQALNASDDLGETETVTITG